MARVDLLAVIAITFCLAVLAMAFVNRRVSRTREQACLDNLKRVNQALLLYSNDHRQFLPSPTREYPGEFWWWYKESIKSYTTPGAGSPDASRVFACPSDRGYTEDKPFCETARFDFGSYVYNGVTLPGVPNISGWNIARVRNPGRTLLAMEWPAHGPLSWHRSRTGKRNGPFYRDAEAIVGFVDGRVRMTPIYYDGHSPAYAQDPIGGYDYQFGGE